MSKSTIKKTKILSIFNSKGGVGKTSSVLNISSILSHMGYKVLCIDLDYQCNLTQGFGITPNAEKNIFKLFSSEDPYNENPKDYIINTQYDNIDLISGSKQMKYLERRIIIPNGREFILFESFKNLVEENTYDYILFDNSPANHLALANSFYLSHYALAPLVIGEQFAIDGLNGLFDSVNECLRGNQNFKALKIFINKYDKRVLGIDKYLNGVASVYSEYLLNSVIRISSAIENAQKLRLPVDKFDKNSKGAVDFTDLTKEIISL